MDLEAYWDDRIKARGRYSATGHVGYPERINRCRKERVKDDIEQVCETHDIAIDGADVLDAGCGTGIYSEFYADHGASVTGFDFSEAAIDDIRQRGVPGDYHVRALPDSGFSDGEFDLVHCFSVLYHLTDDTSWRDSIRELARVTAPGGTVLLRVEWTDDPGADSAHYTTRSKDQYRTVFKDGGLELLESYPIHDAPQYPRIARRLPRLAIWLDLFDGVTNRMLVLQKPSP